MKPSRVSVVMFCALFTFNVIAAEDKPAPKPEQKPEVKPPEKALVDKPADGDINVLRAFSRAVSSVAASARPAVVSIYTTRTVKVRRTPFFENLPAPFDELFKDQEKMLPDREQEFRSRGLGSGFIIDAEKGYILTNNHVISGADDIKVHMMGGEEYEAKVVGVDTKTDIAIIKITAKNLKALKLGDSDKMQVGEFVIAVGSPFGLRETVSTGIISAQGRTGLGIEDYEDFIQTDAAINVGNSGGPLLNVEGEVIGVNTAIFSRSGGSVGVGFAIPINMAKDIVAQLINDGTVTRGWLGVQIQEITPDIAEKFGLKSTEGALVAMVMDNTPAAAAGLKQGDVITQLNGKKIDSVSRFRSRIASTKPGDSVVLTVLRDGKTQVINVKIAKLEEKAASGEEEPAEAVALGMNVKDLTAETATNLGVSAKRGAVVESVTPGSPAESAGIGPGDVITEVDRKPVNGASELRTALEKADLKKGVMLHVMNKQGSRFVIIKTNK